MKVLPGVRELGEDDVVFDDGSRHAFDAVVAATGYAPRADRFVQVADLALDESGCPAQSGAEVAPGLYFCGMHIAPSGMLHEIALEARRIVRHIAERPSSN